MGQGTGGSVHKTLSPVVITEKVPEPSGKKVPPGKTQGEEQRGERVTTWQLPNTKWTLAFRSNTYCFEAHLAYVSHYPDTDKSPLPGCLKESDHMAESPSMLSAQLQRGHRAQPPGLPNLFKPRRSSHTRDILSTICQHPTSL